MKAFSYLAPGCAEEAIALLVQHGADARVIAGGQSLLLGMKDRTERPKVLVSLAGIADFRGVHVSRVGELVVGATTTYAQLTRLALTGWHTEISAMAGNLADRPVRTMGTIGGALCAADPRYDMLTLVVGAGAYLEVLSPSGVRSMTPQQFFLAEGGIAIGSAEILVAIRFPAAAEFGSVAFHKFRQRTFDAAVVSAFCAVRLGPGDVIAEIRLAVGAATPVPVLAATSTADLVGRPPGKIDVAAVADAAAVEVLGASAPSNTVTYHRELIKALSRKALSGALNNAAVKTARS